MIVYTGPVDDSHQLIQFFRREVNNLHALRKLIVSPGGSVVQDCNGDGMEFPGLTHGCSVLNRLLRELGIVFPTKTLHDPTSTPDGVREFDLSACWTWGHG
jgi:hypothetical protein